MSAQSCNWKPRRSNTSTALVPGQPVHSHMPRQLLEMGHAIENCFFVYVAELLSNRILSTNQIGYKIVIPR